MSLEKPRNEFLKVTRRVLRKNLTKNPKTLLKHKEDNIKAFNDYSTLINRIFRAGDDTVKLKAKEYYKEALEKIDEALKILNFKTNLPNYVGGLIDINLVETENSGKKNKRGTNINASDIDISQLFQSTSTITSINTENNSQQNQNLINNNKMTQNNMTTVDFIKFASTTIGQSYSGDPLTLQSFINAINLVTRAATTEELKTILVDVVKAKLSGKALEVIPEGANTVDLIQNALKDNIKPDPSKVIEGKLAALRIDKQPLQDFSKTAEELADGLRRSLVIEGMSLAKANEMTVNSTVKMCRQAARTDLVKSVLAATKFTDPKDVISTFLVEIGQQSEEKRVLAYRTTRRNEQNYFNKNNRGRTNRYGDYRRNNYQNNYNNNYHGRGRGRRNNNQNNRNYNNNQNNNQRGHGNRNYNDRNVRYTQSGNGQSQISQQRDQMENHNEI